MYSNVLVGSPNKRGLICSRYLTSWVTLVRHAPGILDPSDINVIGTLYTSTPIITTVKGHRTVCTLNAHSSPMIISTTRYCELFRRSWNRGCFGPGSAQGAARSGAVPIALQTPGSAISAASSGICQSRHRKISSFRSTPDAAKTRTGLCSQHVWTSFLYTTKRGDVRLNHPALCTLALVKLSL